MLLRYFDILLVFILLCMLHAYMDLFMVCLFSGRFDFDDCIIICNSCGHRYGNSISSLIYAGFWPGNVTRGLNYLFSVELFRFFDLLQKYLPGTSIAGFIHTLEQLSSHHGRVRKC